jgi:DeoR/GlpR family transcriptional regulator of sugar metabolism
VIYLDAGTTTLAIASRIADRRGLTVITNDFAIVDELAVTGEIETVHIGGRVDFDNRSTVGLIAAGTLRGLNIDLALISASSWSTRQGVTTPSPEKVQVKAAAMGASLTSALVADSTKYGSFSLYKAAELTDFNTVITDDALPARAAENLRAGGVDLVLAPVE